MFSSAFLLCQGGGKRRKESSNGKERESLPYRLYLFKYNSFFEEFINFL